jgi:predicted small lipoprotein YifL
MRLKLFSVIIVLFSVCLISACGQSGKLYLPQPQAKQTHAA